MKSIIPHNKEIYVGCEMLTEICWKISDKMMRAIKSIYDLTKKIIRGELTVRTTIYHKPAT